MKTGRICAVMMLLAILTAATLIHGQPSMISFQGKLTDLQYNPWQESVSIQFGIYSAAEGGEPLWSELQENVIAGDGIVDILLGSADPIPKTVFDGGDRWLGIKVGGDSEMTPRTRIASVGYSFRSAFAETALCAMTVPGIIPGPVIPKDYIAKFSNSGLDASIIYQHPTSGNIGIGTTTPTAKLDIEDADVATARIGGNMSQLEIVRSGLSTIASVRFSTGSFGGYIAGWDIGLISGLDDRFVINATTTGNGLSVLQNGSVGIGVIWPGAKFDVAGTAKMTGFQMPTGASNGFILTSDASGVGTWQPGGTGGISGSGTINYVPKFTGTTSIGNSVIYESGPDIGIGTTIPRKNLEVMGDGILLDSPTGNPEIQMYGSGGRSHFLRPADPPGTFEITNNALTNEVLSISKYDVGIGTTTPGYLLDVAGPAHASSFPTSSDARLKANIKQLTNVLEKLQSIRGVSFDWNDLYESFGRSTGHREIGVIAQEVEAVFPELVTTWGEEEYRAVDYGRLTAVLVEAVKEQQAQIEELKAEIADLKVRVR